MHRLFGGRMVTARSRNWLKLYGLLRNYWSRLREIAIAASFLVRVQFMSRRRERIETSSPRKTPIRDRQPDTPLTSSSLGKVKTMAAALATSLVNSGFGLRPS